MTCTFRSCVGPLFVTLVALGCAQPASIVDPFEDSPFSLVLEGETVRPEDGWIQRTEQSSQAEMRLSGEWGAVSVHIDTHRWQPNGPPLAFQTGAVIVDGPAEDGRGEHRDYTGDYSRHSPWIDAVLCARETGASEECFQADLITFEVAATDDPAWVWIRFRLDFEALDEPVVGAYRTLARVTDDSLQDHYPR